MKGILELTSGRKVSVILFVLVLHLNSQGATTCPLLKPLAFGQLTLNNNATDITCNQPQYKNDDQIRYRCASGYVLVNATDNATLVQTTATCNETIQEWSLIGVACIVRGCGSPPFLNNGVISVEDPSYLVGSIISYRCNSGYRLDRTDSINNVVMSVCTNEGRWHLTPTCISDTAPLLSAYNVLVVILAIVAAICAVLMFLIFACSLWVFKLRKDMNRGDMAEDEVEYTRSQGAFTLNNPLVITKEDESTGNPLYLTPEEMDEFENRKKTKQP